MAKIDMDKLINHLKSAGFIFQGSEIYGGLANSWDYGPLGVELKNNLKAMWWNHFVRSKKMNVGLDSSIILNSNVWKASGHLGNFSDPLIDCKECKSRFRADKIVEEQLKISVDGLKSTELEKLIIEKDIKCPKCGKVNFTSIRQFMLMFETNVGVVKNENSTVYLRPETAQGVFINYKNVQRSMRKKLPFGIGQIGKSFRNEITPGNFIFRTREFEQMEMEFFFDPKDKFDWFEYWLNEVKIFLSTKLGISEGEFILREHEKDELSHYSNRTVDIEYMFPFGKGELWGIAHRSDFDLNAHQAVSKQDLSYFRPEDNTKVVPYVIEPSVGVERLILALLCSSFKERVSETDDRTLMQLPFELSPYKIAILPLQKQQAELAEKIQDQLSGFVSTTYDVAGQIGKRYRRQDSTGTPFCVTVDFDSENDNSVTIRNRDTMKQERIKIDEILSYIQKNK
ncbi:glycyl-tRNA synthetase [Spiroplasma sp. TIUS-1]|uniref:glycine--tRNA ligase n=1 Tax=Spiroplasma sp. TIUS-1 TaxID=216963 RepID=UPI001396E3A4|nr:glycine--tRNA ligase [Spiroplasma sp. TIUS-1]QHX35967.1 glycyl-tRNA synthetase [Spiroplasma sp. TIUS-1]